MPEKFVDDILAEQQKIADTIVKLKSEIKQVHDSVGDKEVKIQELAGKLDVLKQVHDFYTKGTIQPEQQQPPQQEMPADPEPEPETQSVFNPDQEEGQPGTT